MKRIGVFSNPFKITLLIGIHSLKMTCCQINEETREQQADTKLSKIPPNDAVMKQPWKFRAHSTVWNASQSIQL